MASSQRTGEGALNAPPPELVGGFVSNLRLKPTSRDAAAVIKEDVA